MHNVNHIHSCGYHCDKPGCIKEQRDDLVKKFIVNAINPLIESNLRKAAQQAMEALETKGEHHSRVYEAIAALRTALAQPEPEPVCDKDPRGCWNVRCQLGKVCKNIPPQRKPLTNGEIYTAYITATNQTLRAQDEKLALEFARAIEQAHGIGVSHE